MSTSLNLFHSFSFIVFFFWLPWFFFIFIYLFLRVFGYFSFLSGCRGIFLEMDSQEETVSIQRFEIGIHKDLPIKETIFLGGEGSSEVLLNGFFSFFS